MYVETTSRYRMLGEREAVLCHRCASAHLARCYTLPLLACVVAESLMLHGWVFGAVLSSAAIQTLTAVCVIVSLGVALAAKDVVLHPLVRAKHHPVRLPGLTVAALLAVWGVGGTGPLFLLIRSFDLTAGQHSLADSSLPAWIAVLVRTAQLVLVLAVHLAPGPLLEFHAWRQSISTLRSEFGPGRLTGFNSVRYAGLSPSADDHDRPPTRPSRPGRHR